MRSRGFSLLEALVTLVIVSLIATVLMQSLLHVLGMRERVLRADREARTGLLHERWFRESVSAAVGDRPDGQPFTGDARQLRFLSHAPLASEGVSPVAWMIVESPEGAMHLAYREGSESWPLTPAGMSAAAFEYLDAGGSWHPSWPVAERPQETLPRAVRFAAAQEGSPPLLWWVAVAAGSGLPPTLQNIEALPNGTL